MVKPITPPPAISTLDRTLEQEVTAVLKDFGWAPGGYTFDCRDCPPNLPFDRRAIGDKRSWRCKEHAIIQLHQQYLIADNDSKEMHRHNEQIRAEHEKRVSGLIAANSEQVIRRREINAHRWKLIGAALHAAKIFRYYAMLHRDKRTQEGDEKAKRNDDMADELEAALVWESEPGAMGRP